jgi:type IV pilus assembly protein PilX
MSKQAMRSPGFERGMALVSALLLLLVMTVLGIAMFRTFGMQERIAGNTREKQRAVHAADSAEAYAEWWLSSAGGINATGGVVCNALVSADANNTQVCSNQLSAVVPGGDVAAVPWTIGGAAVGNTYTPPGLTTGIGGANTYLQVPLFYISYVSGSYNSVTGLQTNSYQIDSVGYGGTNNAVSVVESAYVVSRLYTTQGNKQKYINLGGP